LQDEGEPSLALLHGKWGEQFDGPELLLLQGWGPDPPRFPDVGEQGVLLPYVDIFNCQAFLPL
jgi:hypothetical protein